MVQIKDQERDGKSVLEMKAAAADFRGERKPFYNLRDTKKKGEEKLSKESEIIEA